MVFAPLPSLAPRTQVVFRVARAGRSRGAGRMRVRLTGDQFEEPLFRDYNSMVVPLAVRVIVGDEARTNGSASKQSLKLSIFERFLCRTGGWSLCYLATHSTHLRPRTKQP